MNTNNDRQHLKLLSIFHYVVGGIIAFFSLIPVIHLVVGMFLIISPESFPIEPSANSSAPNPESIGYLFATVGALYFILGELVAIATILSGRLLKLRKRYWFSFITACILCLFTPFGTILGVFTLVVLSRQSVKELYFSSN